MVVNIVDVGWATSKSGCLPISALEIYTSIFNLWVLHHTNLSPLWMVQPTAAAGAAGAVPLWYEG
jgi:hypothetical protein